MTEEHLPREKYAGLGIRSLAMLIDFLCAAPVYIALQAALPQHVADWGFVALMMVAYSAFFSMRWQGTPGMWISKIHVQRTDGSKLTFVQALAWCVVSTVGVMIVLAAVLYLDAVVDVQAVQAKLNELKAGTVDDTVAVQQLESMMGMTLEQFRNLALISLVFTLVASVVWVASILRSREKAGFHNWVCKTRFVKGRPLV